MFLLLRIALINTHTKARHFTTICIYFCTHTPMATQFVVRRHTLYGWDWDGEKMASPQNWLTTAAD